MPAKTNEELYEEAERALIGEAIAETEQEIHDSAFDNAPDDNDGDTSLEEMDPDDVIDDDVDDESEDSDIAEEEDDDREPEQEEHFDGPIAPDTRKTADQADRVERRGIPSSRLREEAEARRQAEASARELRSELDQLKGQFQSLQSTFRPQQQQQPPQQGPDMFADPEGWAAAERNRIMQEVNNRHFNASLADAAEQHGDKFQQAFKELSGLNPDDPANKALAHRIYFAPNPGREVMKWHQQQSLIREIGTDPTAYKQKLRDELLSDPEIRQQLISGMRNDAKSNQRTSVRIPPSLNGATGGTSHRGQDRTSRDTAYTTRSIEKEIADSVWDE